MRKLGVLSVVLAITLTASFAHSATMSFGVKGGMAVPTGDLSDFVDPGFAGGVFADMWFTPQMALGADIAGNFFSGDFDEPGFGEVKTKLDVIQFGVHGMNSFGSQGSSFAPWIQYGVAMYNGKTEVETPLGTGESSDSDLGIHGGAGIEFGGGSTMRFGVGGEYHHVFTEGDASSFFSILARLTFLTTGTTQ